MIFLDWMMLCQRSIVDKTTNTTSLIDVIEEIKIPPPPVPPTGEQQQGVFLQYTITAMVRTETDLPERQRCRLKLFAPDDFVLFERDIEYEFFGQRRTRLQFNGAALPIRGEGVYRFSLQLPEGDDWSEKGLARVDVQFVADLAAGSTAPGVPGSQS
jgi:hypothetical protein